MIRPRLSFRAIKQVVNRLLKTRYLEGADSISLRPQGRFSDTARLLRCYNHNSVPLRAGARSATQHYRESALVQLCVPDHELLNRIQSISVFVGSDSVTPVTMPGHNRSHRQRDCVNTTDESIGLIAATRLNFDHQFTVQYRLIKESDVSRPRRRRPLTPPVSPAHHADCSSRRRSSPHLHAHNPTLSRCYTNAPICDAPCPPPTPPASRYYPVSPATDPAAIQPGFVLSASGVDAAAAAAEASFTLKAPDVSGAHAAAV